MHNFLCNFLNLFIYSIEEKTKSIDEEDVRMQLYKALMLSVTEHGWGDWSTYKTRYSFNDKQFLNRQFSKYGKYYIKELLSTVYQLQIDELLPEILVSIRDSFKGAEADYSKFEEDIKQRNSIVSMFILKPFLSYSDKIKQDQELIEAYEDILEILTELNYEEAAVILDEFRVY